MSVLLRQAGGAPRLFMTATPRYYTPRVRHEARQVDVEIASMDDESVFGPVLHLLTFGEAIERDLLSDYQVVVVGVDDGTYRNYADRGELITRDGRRATDARALAGQIGLAKAMRKWDLRRVVSFHGRVAAARRFSDDVPDVIAWMPPGARPKGSLWSQHVSGAMPSGRRDRLLLHFRNLGPQERGLLSNARCLGEGVDVPSIDGVAFVDPRRSTIDIIQALGRAIRKAPDKKVGTVVLPVFVRTDADADAALNDSTFRHVWEVLKALRAHDESLGEELDDLRRRLGARRGTLHRPAKLHLDVPTAVGQQFARAFDVRLVELTTSSWEFWFGLLQRFTDREDHSRVPIGCIEDGSRLGAWVNKQRTAFGRGTLSRQRQKRLEALPGWTWDVLDDQWEAGLTRLRRYVSREGNSRVRKDHRDDDGYQLGGWVAAQRRKKHRLSKDRVQRVEALPGWVWDTREAAWEDGYMRLRKFVEREGHSRVPVTYRDDDGYLLGQWTNNQRAPQRRGHLSTERARRLDALRAWVPHTQEASWEDGYARLRQFSERHGYAGVPQSYRDADKYPLGVWVHRQRQLRRQDRLPEERIRSLEVLPGWAWTPRDARWEEGYARLSRFVEREGHSRVPGSYRDDDGYRLGNWVQSQRGLRKRGELPKERAKALEALPRWAWKGQEAKWEDGYARLVQFVEREGHADVPFGHRDEDGYQLGAWVGHQRGFRNQRQRRMMRERVTRLEALPGWVW